MSVDIVYSSLKARIRNNELEAGTLCPGENALSAEYGVSRETVRAALKQLAHENYVTPGSRGRRRRICRLEPICLPKIRVATGSFGAYLESRGEKPRDAILGGPEKVQVRDLSTSGRLRARDVASALEIDAQSTVIWCLRLRYAEDVPIALQWVAVPCRIVNRIDYQDLRPGGLTAVYRNRFGILRESVTAGYGSTLAADNEAKLLHLETGAPLIEEHRVSWCRIGRRSKSVAYEYLVSLYCDRVSIEFEWHGWEQART